MTALVHPFSGSWKEPMLTPETEGHIAVAVWPGDRVVENNGVLGRNALRRQKGRNDDEGEWQERRGEKEGGKEVMSTG